VDVQFANELKAWGPQAASRTLSVAEAEAYCRALACTHYENFPLVSWMLPRRLQQHFYNVYAYCRWADNLGDEVQDAGQAIELLAWWRAQLGDCYRGSASHPVFIALGPTIERFAIPPQPFEDLLSAFEQDQRVREYDSFDELREYCRRSADPVGRLVLYLCGCFSERNAGWSDSICTGLQLANFWQDVARDFDIGRVYIPRDTRRRFGYSDRDLHDRLTNGTFVELMRFEVERARQFLHDGLPLVEVLPWRLQIDVDLFARGGLRILDRIEKIGYRVWQTRPVVTKFDFARLFFGSLGRGLVRRLHRRRVLPAGLP
jgi:squalene synthase HpnC